MSGAGSGEGRRGDGGWGRPEPLRPWHLPGWAEGPDQEWQGGRTAAGTPFRVPRLSAAEAEELARGVREAALAARSELTVARVIRAVDAAAARLLGRDGGPDASGAVLLLRRELGWSEGTARETLAEMASGWRAPALASVVREELGDPERLDGFRPAPGADGTETRMRRAAGPPLLFQVQSGNLPGVGTTGIVRALLVRSGVLVRASEDEPGLAARFARALQEVEPRLGRSVAVTWWPAGDPGPWTGWVKCSGKVVVYGGADAVRGVRDRVPPEVDLVAYGPKVGVGVLLPDAEAGPAARELARDVCAYEQRGCVSPRVVFAVGGGRERFARELDSALSEKVKELPAGALEPGEAAAVRALRAGVEFRRYAAEEGGGSGAAPADRVVGEPDRVRWTVLTGPEPRVRSEALPRVVRVYGVAGLGELEEVLRPWEGRVQAAGYAGREGEAELAALCARLGVSRVARFGRVAWPPPDWRHDGRHQLLPLLRWTDWEPGRAGPG